MIELKNDRLIVSFPEVHPEAELVVTFHRTLRIPDDDRDYPLPPSLGAFPLRHVDDFAARVPEAWRRRGGVMLPMYPAEAMWLGFQSPHGYPFAVQVATGKVDAVSGEPWREGLSREPQNFLAIPDQPWLDGYVVAKGAIRQFVAMPLGSGYSVEEQLTGAAEHGGVQLRFVPLRADVWERERRRRAAERDVRFDVLPSAPLALAGMGLAPGGRMRQEVYESHRPLGDWDPRRAGRCFAHLTNALVWRAITGAEPPTTPPTAEEYNRYGLPWFEYYAPEKTAVGPTGLVERIRSVARLGREKGDSPLPENPSVEPEHVVTLGARRPDEVREGTF